MPEAKQNSFLYLILIPIVLGSTSPWCWEKVAAMIEDTPGPTSYRVRVKTASHKDAGTDAGALYIRLHGDRASAPAFP